jgi:hypothetical protein
MASFFTGYCYRDSEKLVQIAAKGSGAVQRVIAWCDSGRAGAFGEMNSRHGADSRWE